MAASLLAAMVVSACAGPAVGTGAYRRSADRALTAMSGTLASADLATRLDQDGRMFYTVTADAVTNAEDDASSIAQSFTTRQPPSTADAQLGSRVSEALDAASGALRDLRVAVRQRHEAAVRSALTEIARAQAECRRLQQDLQ
jgi:hypothetical protein